MSWLTHRSISALSCAPITTFGALAITSAAAFALGRRDRDHHHGNVGVGKGRLEGQIVGRTVRVERDQGGIVDRDVRPIG
jgi:hypothetical protein